MMDSTADFYVSGKEPGVEQVFRFKIFLSTL